MARVLDSVKKFVTAVILLTICTSVVIFLFGQLIATPVKLPILLAQSVETVIVIVSGSISILLIRHFRQTMSKRIGLHPATIFSFLMVLITIIVMIFVTLDILQVSPTSLLLGGGIVSIVIGLVVSTLVGTTLMGTLVLMTNMFNVGDSVLVNNVPGRIEGTTAMFTRIRSDLGGEIIIPNSALIQGSVIITKISSGDSGPQSRLPYSLGDRIYTTYLNEEGIVKEISMFHTKILLDSGKEITFMNTSVIAGTVAIAKVDHSRITMK